MKAEILTMSKSTGVRHEEYRGQSTGVRHELLS